MHVYAISGKCLKTDDLSSTSSEDVLKLTHGKIPHSINAREMQKSKCPTISTPNAKCVANAEAKKGKILSLFPLYSKAYSYIELCYFTLFLENECYENSHLFTI